MAALTDKSRKNLAESIGNDSAIEIRDRLNGTYPDDVSVGGALAVTGGTTLSGSLAVTGDTAFTGAIKLPLAVASANGAITVKSGLVVITKATAAALTLADPTATTDDGKELVIVSATAAAHTIDNSAGSGFSGAGAVGDVCTFSAAKGNTLRLVAYQGVWYTVTNIGGTMA